MANDYTKTPLADQAKMMAQEEKNWRLFDAKARMWEAALTELSQSGKVLGQETDELEPFWKDKAGTELVTRARNTKRVVDRWAHNIQSAKPQEPLNKLPEAIRNAKATVDANVVAFEKHWGQLQLNPTGPGMSREEAEIPFRKPGGTLMNTVAELYEQAAAAVEKATAGGPYEGVNTVPKPNPQTVAGGVPAGGGPAGGLPQGGPAANPDIQGTMVPSGGPQAGVGGTGPQPGAGGADVSPQSQNPALSGGLGGAPATPPVLPQTGTGLPGGGTGLPGAGTGLPGGLGGVPPVGPVTGIGTGTRPGGLPGPAPGPVGGTGGSGSGVKLPGVSLGGGGGAGGGIGPVGGGGIGGAGGTTIPAAAAPFEAPASAGPSGTAPTAPPPLAAASSGTASGAGGMGGIPPMMPPMGTGGAGSGGGPGSGAASRSGGNRNRRKEVVTPGLPVMLSGKAGMADLNAFAGRGRKQVAESDVPTTVQLIDEDLWQVEQKPAAEERVVAPVRGAH